MIKEFKEFIMRGNVIDMAVGIIIGASFGSIINSLVNDIIMPPIGLLMGKVDFSNRYILLQPGASYDTLADAQAAGAVTLNYGLFINSIINFLIVGLAVFLLIKAVNRMHVQKPAEPDEPTVKECPFCYTEIPIKASRCPNCTSEIKKK